MHEYKLIQQYNLYGFEGHMYGIACPTLVTSAKPIIFPWLYSMCPA